MVLVKCAIVTFFSFSENWQKGGHARRRQLRRRSDASMLGEADFIGKFMRLLSGSNESLFFSHSSFTDALLSFVSLFDSSIVMLHFESKSEFKYCVIV